MAKVNKSSHDELMEKLMPVLVKAIQGDFSGRIPMKKDDPLNEIYAGVQTLLDVITEQIKVLEEMNPSLPRYSQPGSSLPEPSNKD
jgi:hypothetical protein